MARWKNDRKSALKDVAAVASERAGYSVAFAVGDVFTFALGFPKPPHPDIIAMSKREVVAVLRAGGKPCGFIVAGDEWPNAYDLRNGLPGLIDSTGCPESLTHEEAEHVAAEIFKAIEAAAAARPENA
jgi:hypothetical protein